MNRKAEEKRAYQEATAQFEVLRARWPNAFPAKGYLVRPLVGRAAQALGEELGWSTIYARTVLRVWKLKPAYCEAVLRYPTRISLDGSPSDQQVDEKARRMATQALEDIAARRIRKAEAAAAKAQAKAQAPAPEPAPAAPAEAEKPRKLVLLGSAAMQAALKRRIASGAVTTEILQAVPAAAPRRQRAR
jgi:sRNA-binding protein